MSSQRDLFLVTCIVTSLVSVVTSLHLQSGAIGGRTEKDERDDLFGQVLRGLEKATKFFREDYSSINVDGLFGIRLAQGTIIQSLEWCLHGHASKCPPMLQQRLVRLNNTIGDLAAKALPYIEAEDPAYYESFIKTIDSPYLIQPSSRSLGDAIAEAGSLDEYDEDRGDRCLSSLMGTWNEDDSTQPTCTVASGCLDMMTKPGQAKYSITHQLLFFIVAEKNGCLENMDELLNEAVGVTTKGLERQLCGRIYSEMLQEARGGQVPTLHQDLFLEQNLLCGVIGFEEFFKPEWTRLIMTWQTAQGCFGMPRSLISIQEKVEAVSEEQRVLLEAMRQEADDIDAQSNYQHAHGTSWTSRKLMRERVMQGDCLSHKSGLGIGVLGVIQRHLLTTS